MKLIPTLRFTLIADAVVCFLFGVALAVIPHRLAALLTLPTFSLFGASADDCLRTLGLSVIAAGVYVLWTARGNPLRPALVWPIIVVEIVWLIGCGGLLWQFGAQLTGLGVGFVLASAAAVFLFFVLELYGLARLRTAFSNRT